jgi:membrane protease YdiL (CAAX protease family)
MTDLSTYEPRGLHGFIVRYPVATFLATALPLALAVLALPILAEYGRIPGKNLPGLVGLSMEEAASFLMIIVLFSTAVAFTRMVDSREGVRIFFRRMARWRVGLRWWALAVLVLPTGTVLLAILFGDQAKLPSTSVLAGEVVSLIVALLFVNLAEEAVWCGYLQTRMERKVPFLVASTLTAVPFALVHVPIRVVAREVTTAADLLGAFVQVLILGVFVRALFGAAMHGAANSVLLAASTHTFFNRSNNVDGIAADILTGDQRQGAALLTTAALTIILVIVSRRRLTRAHRRELDARELEPYLSR